MSKKKMTHEGFLIGADSRIPDNYRRRVQLRETKNFWVTSHGGKYHKKFGEGTGDWPVYSLDVTDIQPIENESETDAVIGTKEPGT